MRHAPIDPRLFVENRRRLTERMLPNSLAVVNANDILPTNADGTLRLVANSDLFWLTGVNQEETILLLYPGAEDPKHREILFLRETNDLIATWEGGSSGSRRPGSAPGSGRCTGWGSSPDCSAA